MTTIESWVLAYVFNSCWQVPLLLAFAYGATSALRRHGTSAVHRLWVCTLLLESLLPACSVYLWRGLRGIVSVIGWGDGHGGKAEVTVSAGIGSSKVPLPAHLPGIVLTAYGLILLYFVARLIWGFWKTTAVLRASRPLLLPCEITFCLKRQRNGFDAHDVWIRTAPDIPGPMTIGLRRGIVLLPVGMMERLAKEDLLAVLAHESAHVRRRDFGFNLLYEVICLPVKYHPALWLTRANLIETREMVCDEVAAKAVAGRDHYARSLLRLASMFVQRTASVAPHAIGIFDANTFERRIMKLTTNRKKLGSASRVAILAACTVCGSGTCVFAMALSARVALPSIESATASADGNKTAIVPAGEMAGHIRSRVAPVYPKAAKQARIEGSVVLRAVIGKDGKIDNLQVVSGPKELTASSLDAVRQWVYEPYLLKGEPTDVETNITVTYTIGK